MFTSPSIQNIAPAILKAQKEIGSAVKGSSNPFFKSKYADLGAVMEACKEAFNKNGISVLQPIETSDNGITYVDTILLHESGEYIKSSMKIAVKADNDPQAQGSAVSYARRYSLQSIAFIPAEDDDAETTRQAVIKEFRPASNVTPTTLKCSKCKTTVNDKVADFSKSRFKEIYCMNCQPK